MRRGALGVALVVALAPIAGCASAGGSSPSTTTDAATVAAPTSPPTTSTSSPTVASPSTTATGRTITVTIKGTSVTPKPATVDLKVGEKLTLVVTCNHDDELHLHGFEVEKELKAGVATTVTVTGRDAGVFEVETHEPSLVLMKIAVR